LSHELTLISTIAVSLGYALIGGFVTARLGLSPIVGYLLAGIVVGPFTPGFVADTHLAGQLAEIGVILLMFGVGLHFSFRDLLAVWHVAVPGALVQMAAATALGAGIMWAWGWAPGAALVFGLSLSVASTVVLLRALGDKGAVDSTEGRIAVGWLIVEDMAMVVTLVLLPALALPLGGGPAGGPGAAHGAPPGDLAMTLAITLGKVVAFVALMLIVGARVLPWILNEVARTQSRDLFTLAVVAVAIAVAFGAAELFGVSFALGAFFSGVVINESKHGHRAMEELQPLSDIFAVLFFVSVGMLFDPHILVVEPLKVLATLAVIILGKFLAALLIALAFRQPLATALGISASLAQIGEFSFILAALAVSLKIMPEEGRSLVLAGALISITLNPLLSRFIGLARKRLGAPQPAGA
jgi:CPA2 family monovalent cation:H+ antiporter-2